GPRVCAATDCSEHSMAGWHDLECSFQMQTTTPGEAATAARTERAAKPTREMYDELVVAYDHFNRTLFEGQLPACLITLQRSKKSYGYFKRSRFASAEGEIADEIALNPTHFNS